MVEVVADEETVDDEHKLTSGPIAPSNGSTPRPRPPAPAVPAISASAAALLAGEWNPQENAEFEELGGASPSEHNGSSKYF